MPYDQVGPFVNDGLPALSAETFNALETGIASAHDFIDAFEGGAPTGQSSFVVIDPGGEDDVPLNTVFFRRELSTSTFGYYSAVGSATAFSQTVRTVSVSGTVPVGTNLVVAVAASTPPGGNTYTVTDARGNTYTQARQHVQGSSVQIVVFVCRVTTQLVLGDLITVTANTSVAATAVAVHAVSGAVASSPVDVVASSGSASGVAPNTTTSAPSQQKTIAFAFVGYNAANGGAFTTDPDWVTPTNYATVSTGTGSDKTLQTRYLVQSTTQTAYDFDATIATATAWAAVIVTLKGA